MSFTIGTYTPLLGSSADSRNCLFGRRAELAGLGRVASTALARRSSSIYCGISQWSSGARRRIG
jgi:hypothetical protein